MAQARGFDYDLLRQLLEQNPGWSNYQLAKELSADNEKRGRGGPPVRADAVKQAVTRYGPQWGIKPRAVVRYEEVAPPEGKLATAHKMDTPMRYLRDLAAELQGDQPVTESEVVLRKSALSWRGAMKAGKTIVDLTADGVPIVREARPEELNARGELISLMAWKVPRL